MAGYYLNGYAPPEGVTSREQVKEMQKRLNASGASLKVDGVWGPKTQAAYSASAGGAAGYDKSGARFDETIPESEIKAVQRALGTAQTGVWDAATKQAFYERGDEALYSDVYTDENGNAVRKYGTVYTGNAVAPWTTEKERKKKIAAHIAKDGGQYLGFDGMGGVFDLAGYSSNDYFLQGTAGVTREQLKGTAAENANDVMIQAALRADPIFAQSDGFYVNPDGMFGNIKMPGGISSKAILEAIASARGVELKRDQYLPAVGYFNGTGWEDAPYQSVSDLLSPAYREAPVSLIAETLKAREEEQTAAELTAAEENEAWRKELARYLSRLNAGY